jgi:hypothetical protein
MRTLRPITILATAAVLGLSLTGCSAISGIFGGEQEKLSYEDSPLNEYFSALYGGDMSPEDMQSEADAQQLQIEEAIAACMQAEGFEYIPATDANSGVIFSEGEEWEPEKREWVEKYGYGIFAWPGMEGVSGEGEGEEYVDPNQAYVESLSESEQEAYNEVLWGEMPSEEQMNDPEFDWNSLDGGCQMEASDDVYDPDAFNELYEQYEPLLNAMSELYEEAADLDAVVELDSKWAACMADADYPEFSTQSEAQEKFSNLQSEMYDNAYGEEIDAYYESADPANSEEWKEAAAEEIETALADLECREKLDYTNKALEAQFELEEQFIEDNKTELEAFRAAAEQVM